MAAYKFSLKNFPCFYKIKRMKTSLALFAAIILAQLLCASYTVKVDEIISGYPACKKTASSGGESQASYKDSIKINSADGSESVYLTPLSDIKGLQVKDLMNANLDTPNGGAEFSFLQEPVVDESIDRNSDEYKLYVAAIERNKHKVGDSYRIDLEDAGKGAVNIDFVQTRKFYAFTKISNLFSPDEINAEYREGNVLSFKAKIDINKYYMVSVEKTSKVYEYDPFWGKLPLIGGLFQTEQETKQMKNLFIIRVSEK